MFPFLANTFQFSGSFSVHYIFVRNFSVFCSTYVDEMFELVITTKQLKLSHGIIGLELLVTFGNYIVTRRFAILGILH